MSDSESILLDRWRNRQDAEALAEIVSRHSAMLYATSRRVLGNAADAEDVAQECFVELMQTRVKIRSLATWFHTVAVRRSIDLLRKNRQRVEREKRRARQGGSTGADMQELLTCIDEAIAKLPEELRTPIVFRFLEGRTQEAVASALGVAESTVRYRLDRGIEKTRAILRRRGVQVTTALLTTTLGSNMVEAAPATLTRALGKLAVAGNSVGNSTLPTLLGAGAMKMKLAVSGTAAISIVIGFLALMGPPRTPREADRLSTGTSRAGIEVEQRQADADGRSPAVDEPDGNASAVDIVVRRVAGTVRDAHTGDPVAAAVVEIAGISAVAGAGGAYALSGVSIGEHELTVSAPGYVEELVNVEVTGEEERRDFELEPQLSVLCVDTDGDAVEGASVYLAENVWGESDPKESTSGPLTTNAEGLAVFDDLPRHYRGTSGWRRAIYARLPGELAGIANESHSSAPSGESQPLPEGPVRLVLRETTEVAGIVKVPAGFGVRGVTVRLMSMRVRDPERMFGPSFSRSGSDRHDRWPELFEVHPEADGRFALDGLPTNTTIYLAAEGADLGQAQLMSDDPDRLRRIAFDLTASGTIEGTFTYRDTGEPVAGVVLHALPQGLVSVREAFLAEMDAHGAFRFTGLGANVYNITLPRTFNRSEWTMAVRGLVKVGSGQTVSGIHLHLERGSIVSGTVTESSTGEPVVRVGVAAVNGPERSTSGIGHATTDADGRYSMRLPAGRSKLYLMSIPKGYARPLEDEIVVTIAEGETETENVDFKLSSGDEPVPEFLDPNLEFTKATGRVIDVGGESLEGVLVEAHRQHEKENVGILAARLQIRHTSRTYTDAGGRYELSVAADKQYKIKATGERFSTAWSEVFKVGIDEVHEVEDLLLLRGTSSVEGVVVDPEGQPIEGVVVRASSKNKTDDHRNRPGTDRLGYFRIDYLMPDEIVNMYLHKLGYESRWWQVAPGATGTRFILHPMDGKESHHGKKSVKRAESMLGQPAPDWQVDQWIRKPAPPGRPVRSDGRKTAFVYARLPREWGELDSALDQFGEFQKVCERAGAIPVLILPYTVHESLVRGAIEKRDLRLGVGIDRFVPQSDYHASGATMIAYGRGGSPLSFVIDSDGIIRHVQSGFAGLEARLDR